MKGEFYKMEYEAWDEGTELLSLEEEAAYLRFCHMMYRRRSDIPNRLPALARLWRCHQNKARKILKSLVDAGKIEETQDGHLTNTRVRHELDARETLSTHRSDAGKTGGRRSEDNRKKANDFNGPEVASAATPINQIQAEESRGEENREEKKEMEERVRDEDVLPWEIEEVVTTSPEPQQADNAIVFSRGVIQLTQRQIDEMKTAFRFVKLERELGSSAGFVERKFRENQQAGRPEAWIDILWGVLSKKDREGELRDLTLKANATASAIEHAKVSNAPKKVKLF